MCPQQLLDLWTHHTRRTMQVVNFGSREVGSWARPAAAVTHAQRPRRCASGADPAGALGARLLQLRLRHVQLQVARRCH